MGALEAASVAASLLAAAAVFLGVVWFLLPYAASQACPSCGARARHGEAACAVCGASLARPPEAHPGARPYGFPRPARPRRDRVRIEGGAAFNRGITRRAVTIATAAMALGLSLRLAGMVGALGLPQLPPVLDGTLTIVGGVVAFVGFVFLDAA